MNDNWTAIHLSGRPMVLDKTLESGQVFRWRKRRDPKWGDHYEGAIYGNLVRIKQDGDKLLFTSCPTPGPQFKNRLERYLRLDDDLGAIYAELRRPDGPNGPMARLIEELCGMRMLRQEQWECTGTFILTPVAKINTVKRRVEGISSVFGTSILGTDRKAFPSAKAISEAGESALCELGLGFKAKRLVATASRVALSEIDLLALREATYGEISGIIKNIARSGEASRTDYDARNRILEKVFSSGADRLSPDDYDALVKIIDKIAVDLSEIVRKSYDDALAEITDLRGVGDKVANCVLLMSMDKLKAFPVDTNVEKACGAGTPTN